MPLLEELEQAQTISEPKTVTERLNKGIQGATSTFSNIAQYIPKAPPSQTSGFDTPSFGEGSIDSFSKAITQQESGNYKAVNKDSGALGAYQIMPFHLPKIGLKDTPENRQLYLNSPKLQDDLHKKIIGDLYNRYGGSFQKMAAAYYGGDGGAQVFGTAAGDKPQGGGKYPSINQYVKSVMGKMSKISPQKSFSIASMDNSSDYNVSQISPKAYNGIKNAMASLGSKTVDYGGSTHYESTHPGIDIANKIGTPIKAFAPGVVTEVVTGKKQGDNGFGNYIIVTDAYGGKHRYSHLSQSFVRVGDKVSPGKPVASMGNTGSTYSESGGTGSHLDYRIKDAAGRYQNPYQYLAKFYNQ